MGEFNKGIAFSSSVEVLECKWTRESCGETKNDKGDSARQSRCAVSARDPCERERILLEMMKLKACYTAFRLSKSREVLTALTTHTSLQTQGVHKNLKHEGKQIYLECEQSGSFCVKQNYIHSK